MSEVHNEPYEATSSPGGDREVASEEMPADQDAALAAASRWTWRYLLTPSLFRRSVTGADSAVEEYARAHHVIERRKVVLHTQPAHGRRKKDERPLPDAPQVDPWALDNDTLISSSNVIARCPACEGTKKVMCGACDGSSRICCGGCRGGGKVQGQKGLKNCPNCRGKGNVRCDNCRGGKVDCVTCETVGRVEAWLALATELLHQTPAHPVNAAMLVHARVADVADFDADPSTWLNGLVDDTRDQPPGDIDLPAALEPRLDPVSDRVLSSRVQRFSSVVHRFRYATLLSSGTVQVAGMPPKVAKNSDWQALKRRAWLLGGACVVLCMAVFQTKLAYLSKSAWHNEFGHGDALTWLAVVSGMALVGALAGLALPRKTWSTTTVWAPSGAVLASIALVLVAFNIGGPTKIEAEDALARGDVRHASVVAASMVRLGNNVEAGREVLDELQYKELLSAASLPEKGRLVNGTWYGAKYRDMARAHFMATAKAAAEPLVKKCAPQRLDSLGRDVAVVDAKYAANLRSVASLCRIPQCDDCSCVTENLSKAVAVPQEARVEVRAIARKAFRTVFDKAMASAKSARHPKNEVALLKQALSATDCVAKLGAPVSAQVLTEAKSKLSGAQDALEKEQRRAAQAAARKRKQEEARKKREEAIRLAKLRSRDLAPLRCCDGSNSPSCRCGNSRRGCCSHHGGVCGCSAD